MQKIKSLLKKILHKIDINIILIIICITIIFSRLFLQGMIYGHDSFVHLFRIANMSNNIQNGNLFSKIGYNYINGFGYGTGIFYPQINLLLSSIIYMVINDVSISLNIYVYINSLLSGIFMYCFLKYKLKDNNSAIVGSLLYIFAPYFYVQSMIRGATGETVIFLSLPLIFYGIERIFNRDKYGNLLVIIGGIYVLQSHLISTIYVVIFVIVYLLLNYKKLLSKEIIFDLIKCILAIILTSLYFIVPFLEHYKIGGYNMLVDTGSDVSKKVLTFSQLVFNSGNYNIGILLTCMLLVLPLVFDKFKNERKAVLNYLILALISMVMIVCPWIWGHIKFLDVIQFPWRLLSYAIFFLSIVCSYLFKKLDIKHNNIIFALLLIICLSMFQLNNYIMNTNVRDAGFDLNSTVENQIIDRNNSDLHTSLGGNDYLPIECNIDYIASRGPNLIVTKYNIKSIRKNNLEKYYIASNNNLFYNSGKIKTVKNYKFKNGKLSAYIVVDGDTKIELPLIFYLGYNITLNGKKVDYVKNHNGFIEINLNNISGNLKVEYTGTKLDIFANIISLVSFLGINMYYLCKIIKNHRNNKENS